MNTEGLTKQQIRVLEFIIESIEHRGLSPTLEEIRVHLGRKSRGSVHQILVGLRDRNRIRWTEGCNRSITIVGNKAQHRLPADLQAKLEAYCKAHNERPSDVLADALTLHFDALEAAGTNAEVVA
ncbi:hypothetical protein ASD45_08460 [Pseudolabrys sp. Root1462]|uniref:LexA family protein n=1 Tax=Pseudolabrys sp. Root1462 TaxID=1736466 RepID=UPI0007025878|nr:hypothetical protein [Pseudolabrys sp. Root1462]KQZ00885.1 hypothetical protein ASD45_08460 [Pseudolabrys sp. Root1462]